MPHRLIITLVMTPCVGGITGGCQGATPFIGAARRWVGVEEPNSGCCCWSLGDACQGGGKETQQQLWGAEGHPGMCRGDSRAEGPRRCHQQGQAAPWALAGSPGAPPISGRRLPQGGTAWPGMGAGAGVVAGAALGGGTLRLQPLPWWARVTEPPGSPAASTPRRTRAQGAACVWEGDPSPVLCAWRSCQHPVCSLFVLMAGARPS